MEKNYKLIFLICVLFISISEVYCQDRIPGKIFSQFQNFQSVQLTGNSWAVNNAVSQNKVISNKGVSGWENPSNQIFTYFKTEKKGKVHLAIIARVKSGKSIVKCQLGKDTRKLSIINIDFDTLDIGIFKLENIGYQTFILSGIEKTSESFAEITTLLIGGEAIDNQTRFVKDDFYWGRRGPSVHLNFELPADAGDVEWFYNEITIPKGNDVIGSYFMANGFGEGYYGIQVNSATERRILFSVWSPFKTDKPSEIPEDQKIILLKKGKDVNTGAFGNEGSGGQSYRRYYWKSDVTYHFLLKGVPSENNSTDYTAYFFAPEIGQWELIASFRRPKTTTYLKHPHSFLENFSPDNGNITRMGIYSNQWVCSSKGQWTELKRARFTADATARKESRLDYMGGIENGGFFLKNCGFFSETTSIDTWFTRPETGKKPEIDFSILP